MRTKLPVSERRTVIMAKRVARAGGARDYQAQGDGQPTRPKGRMGPEAGDRVLRGRATDRFTAIALSIFLSHISGERAPTKRRHRRGSVPRMVRPTSSAARP